MDLVTDPLLPRTLIDDYRSLRLFNFGISIYSKEDRTYLIAKFSDTDGDVITFGLGVRPKRGPTFVRLIRDKEDSKATQTILKPIRVALGGVLPPPRALISAKGATWVEISDLLNELERYGFQENAIVSLLLYMGGGIDYAAMRMIVDNFASVDQLTFKESDALDDYETPIIAAPKRTARKAAPKARKDATTIPDDEDDDILAAVPPPMPASWGYL